MNRIENLKNLRLLNGYFNKRVLALCKEQIAAGEKLAVALSGGADSVFLLLASIAVLGKENIVAFHFNHKVRKSADADELFVKNLCEQLNIKCVCSSPKKKIDKVSEASLREARIQFFLEAAKENNITLIAQGHHLGDVAETLIMRIMRGSSPEGLCAPRVISKYENVIFVRPLLKLSKQKIKNALTEIKQPWCEDETNASTKFLRNKIRHQVIPILEEVSERSFENMALQCRDLLEEREVFFESYCNALYKVFKTGENTMSVLSPFRAVQRTLIEKFLSIKKAVISSKAMNMLLDSIGRNEDYKMSLKDAFLIFNSASGDLEYVKLAQPNEDFNMELKFGENILPDGSKLIVEEANLGEDCINRAKKESDIKCRVFINADFMPIFVRNRKEKDAYIYMGLQNAKKIQDIFVDKKVEKMKRNAIPVVINKGGEILWVPYAPPSAKCVLKDGAKAIRIIYESSKQK